MRSRILGQTLLRLTGEGRPGFCLPTWNHLIRCSVSLASSSFSSTGGVYFLDFIHLENLTSKQTQDNCRQSGWHDPCSFASDGEARCQLRVHEPPDGLARLYRTLSAQPFLTGVTSRLVTFSAGIPSIPVAPHIGSFHSASPHSHISNHDCHISYPLIQTKPKHYPKHYETAWKVLQSPYRPVRHLRGGRFPQPHLVGICERFRCSDSLDSQPGGSRVNRNRRGYRRATSVSAQHAIRRVVR
jgi:hypothetical protein